MTASTAISFLDLEFIYNLTWVSLIAAQVESLLITKCIAPNTIVPWPEWKIYKQKNIALREKQNNIILLNERTRTNVSSAQIQQWMATLTFI